MAARLSPLEEQAKLLDEAVNVVKTQAFYMKRCLDTDKLMDALKHCSNMVCELRTSLLSPTSYYELFIMVSDELRHLEMHLYDLHKSGKRIGDLYELVQYAGNIVPRLYLLITVGAVYIKTKEAPACDVLRDLVEMCKGVQHPTRGLFLRKYLEQMTKDKLPDIDSEYEGEVEDSIDFVIHNFTEMNKLWVRLSFGTSSPAQKAKRQKERRQLRMLVATNLQRLSQLEGVDNPTYVAVVLPRILEQVVSCRDALAQEHLMESIVQVFPDEFHLHTLDKLLRACGKLVADVDIKVIIVGLIDRLADFAQASPEAIPDSLQIFEIFQEHIAAVIAARETMPIEDVLMLQVSLLNLSLQCYPDRLDYVDGVLGYCGDLLAASGLENVDANPACAKQLVNLLNIPVDTYRNILTVLELSNYERLIGFLGYLPRKMVAVYIVKNTLAHGTRLDEPSQVVKLLSLVGPLVRDADDQEDEDEEDFADEQELVARLIHRFANADSPDVQFQIYVAARRVFGEGGDNRIPYTLVPLVMSALRLCVKYHTLQDEDDLWQKKCQKVFQFAHQTLTPLKELRPEMTLRLFLQAAQSADRCGFETIAYEFVSQAFLVYEEFVSDSREQLNAITLIIGAVQQMTSFGEESFEALVTKSAQHSSRLLKLTDRCRAVYLVSHLFWCDGEDGFREAKRVLECLQKSLKIADKVMQTGNNVSLFVAILDQYLYYYQQENEAVTVKYLNGLLQLINTNIASLDGSSEGGDPAAVHYRNTLAHIRFKQARSSDSGGPAYDDIEIP